MASPEDEALMRRAGKFKALKAQRDRFRRARIRLETVDEGMWPARDSTVALAESEYRRTRRKLVEALERAEGEVTP